MFGVRITSSRIPRVSGIIEFYEARQKRPSYGMREIWRIYLLEQGLAKPLGGSAASGPEALDASATLVMSLPLYSQCSLGFETK